MVSTALLQSCRWGRVWAWSSRLQAPILERVPDPPHASDSPLAPWGRYSLPGTAPKDPPKPPVRMSFWVNLVPEQVLAQGHPSAAFQPEKTGQWPL